MAITVDKVYIYIYKWHACPGSYNKNLARRGEGKKGGEWEEDERGVMGGEGQEERGGRLAGRRRRRRRRKRRRRRRMR